MKSLLILSAQGPVNWYYSAADPAPDTFFSGPNEAIDLAIVGIVDTLSR